ncbi:DUF3099 domain-containing protein [Glutamicibacter sp.]|uniref:DUF3099 domain-containing protein n=1 Tax=Glutamicibacter sp. TaxID=1931995 RepID=UPI0028BE015A|nr:DUF3099 domain-containing protein [Glutamicibacter sp.]
MSQHHAHPESNDPQVHRITDARESHTAERDVRIRKYTITMTIRVICFILAFLASGWLRWALLIGAVFLPYVAVVIANGGSDITKREPPAEFYRPDEPGQLNASDSAVPEPPANSEVIDGTLAEDSETNEQPANPATGNSDESTETKED